MPIAVGVVGTIVIALRGPRPSLAWEDGPVFWGQAGGGLSSILAPYAGYLHLVARSIALVAHAFGSSQLMWLGALAVTLYVASYLASDHLTPVLPERWQRLAAGIAVVVLPGTVQTLGLIATAQWYGELYLLAWLVAGSANRLGLAAFALTGPFSLLFTPLVLLRRPAGWPIVLAGAAVQALAFATSPRGSSLELDRLPEVLVFRGVLGPFFGEFALDQVPLAQAVAAVVLVSVLAAIAIRSDRELWPAFLGGAVVAVVGVMFAGESNDLFFQWPGARYFLGLSFAFVLFVLRHPRWELAWVLGLLLAMGIVDDFYVPARDYYGWLP